MIPCIATSAAEGKGNRAQGSTQVFACAECGTSFRDMRCRIFRADGRLLCSRCYLDVRNQQRERSAKLITTLAEVCATALTFAAGAAASIGVLIAPTAITVVTGLVGLAVAHVLAELLAPRARRRFTT